MIDELGQWVIDNLILNPTWMGWMFLSFIIVCSIGAICNIVRIIKKAIEG